MSDQALHWGKPRDLLNPDGSLVPVRHFAGDLSPAFLYADGVDLEGVELLRDFRSGLAVSEAERNRLVEGSKSPTRTKALEISKKAFDDRAKRILASTAPLSLPALAAGAYSDLEGREHKIGQTDIETAGVGRDVQTAGTSSIIEYREWADAYRIRTAINGQMTPNPPTNSGERVSAMLSHRAARKIAESCEYMALQKGGFKTFVTGTFSQAVRDELSTFDIETQKPLTTIQKETTRTMDALVKMYQRGWQYKNEAGEVVKVEGHGKDKLRYCWVVEVPKNEQGLDNPHVHMLLDWRVDYAHFAAWSSRIESVWGNGTFHLEKIKDANAAGAYMAKAAGYISKASGKDDQGVVIGNRYAISSDARAPAWVTVSVHEFGIMGQLIRETYDHIQHKYGPDFEARRDIARERAAVNQKMKSAVGDQLKALNKRKSILERGLATVRKKINGLPIRATKYFLEFKGAAALSAFIARAKCVGWGSDAPPSTQWIYSNKLKRGAWLDKGLAKFADFMADRKASFYESANDGWQDYEQWAAG